MGEEKDGVLVRRGIVVHEGIFASMDGQVAVDGARCQRTAANMNAFFAKMGHEYNGSVPIGAYPPILDQHETDSNRRVNGRMTGNFKAELLDIPMVGKGLWAVTSDLAFIGEEAIAMVKDGRIYHLSVCLNETTEMLGEVSSVIEPAAPGAMLLSKGKRSNEKQFKHAEHLIDTWFDEGDKKWYFEVGGHFSSASSEAEATQKAKSKADELYSAQSNKRFSTPPLVPTTKSEKNKNMPNAHKKRLAAKRLHVASLKLLVGSTADSVRLAAEKKAESVRLTSEVKVRSRLSAMMKGGKLTPAEFKKVDVKKLSALATDAQEAALGLMEAREPVILVGQYGSQDAAAASEIRAKAGEDNFKRLKAEAQGDVYKKMGKKIPGKKLAAGEVPDPKKMSVDEKVEKQMAGEPEPSDDKKLAEDKTKCMGEMEKCLEAGDLDGAKKRMGEFKKLGLGGAYAGGDLVAEGLEKVLSEQQMAIDQLHVQLAKLNDALKLMLAAEEAEEQEMAGDPAAAEGEEAELGAEGGKGGDLAAAGGDKPPPGKEGEKNLDGKDGDKPPPAKKEGEGDAPPPKEKEKE